MAYAPNLARIVMTGTLFNQAEIWASTLTLHAAGSDGPAPAPAVLAPPITEWFRRTTSLISNIARLTAVKCNEFGPDGRYVDQTQTRVWEAPNQGIAGGMSSFAWPQLSLAVSLVTAAQRGRAHRGRFYPPLPVVTGDPTTGKVMDASTSSVAVSAAQLIRDINAAAGGWRVVVASHLDGTVRPVTAVEVGDVMDTQRRRRSAFPELYQRSRVDLDPGQVTPV